MRSLIVVWLCSSVTYALVGYDCTHSESKGVTISTFGTSDCPYDETAPNTTLKYIQVLSIKKHEPIQYVHCAVMRSSLIYRCGGFDHIMLVPSSLSVEESISVTAEECDTMARHGRYTTLSGSIIDGIKEGAQSSAHVVDVGMSTPDGKCEGTTLIYLGVTYTSAVKISQYKVLITRASARRLYSSSEVLFSDGIKCPYSRGSCYSPMTGRKTWTVEEDRTPCGTVKYDLLYEGWSNETQSATAPLVITVESAKRNFAIAVHHKSILCGFPGYVTDDDNVIIISGRAGELPQHSLTQDTYDYNPFFDTSLKFVFLERNVANRTNSLYQYFMKRHCEANRARLRHLLSLARTDPEEFAWVYTERPGYTAVTRGEVIHLIQCHAVEVVPRYTEDCFNDLPVSYLNTSMFLKPGSRLLVSYGRPVPCSSLTPVLYLIDGVWIKVGGESYLAPHPIQLSPDPKDVWEYGEIVTLKNVGFLSKDQLESYRDAIVGPVEREAIKEIFLSRVIYQGRTGSQGLDYSHGFDKTSLIEGVSESVVSRLYGYWDFIAKHLGAILGLSLLWNFICSIFGYIVNGFLLFREFGWSSLLVTAFSSTVAKHLLYGKWRRKKSLSPPGNPEADPLDHVEHLHEMQDPMYDPAIPRVRMDDAFHFFPPNMEDRIYPDLRPVRQGDDERNL